MMDLYEAIEVLEEYIAYCVNHQEGYRPNSEELEAMKICLEAAREKAWGVNMKQYQKGRPGGIQLFSCNRNQLCRYSGICGNECKLTSHKEYAVKDRFGKPIVVCRTIPTHHTL